MNRTNFKWLLIIIGAFITTGLLVPWIISNDVFPVWLMIICFFSIGFVWLVILEKPAIRFLKWLSKLVEDNV